jgi:hypothetical protein
MSTKILIEDDRLTPDMERVRNGSQQLFRPKGNNREFLSAENATTVLNPPSQELFAELDETDGRWYWVSGCAECNGKPSDWMTYIECDKHNVCRTCKCPRSALTENPWGGKNGWQCKPCADREHEERKAAALAAVEDAEIDHDYTDKPVCPYCGTEASQEDNIEEDDELECDVCDGEFKVTNVYISVSYSTEKKT